MNHWQLVAAYKGRVINVYDGRRVRIKGPSVPGVAFCESVDGLGTISEISTAFLNPEAIKASCLKPFGQCQCQSRGEHELS